MAVILPALVPVYFVQLLGFMAGAGTLALSIAWL